MCVREIREENDVTRGKRKGHPRRPKTVPGGDHSSALSAQAAPFTPPPGVAGPPPPPAASSTEHERRAATPRKGKPKQKSPEPIFPPSAQDAHASDQRAGFNTLEQHEDEEEEEDDENNALSNLLDGSANDQMFLQMMAQLTGAFGGDNTAQVGPASSLFSALSGAECILFFSCHKEILTHFISRLLGKIAHRHQIQGSSIPTSIAE